MTDKESESVVKKKYQDLSLDLNLDKATADDAWNSYEKIRISYTLEGDQLPWLACALYASCRKRSVPTVGGRPGNMIQGNCVSLTRMLKHCSLPLTDFIKKMKFWLAMSHCDEKFCRKIEMLERNFAVSSNIFKQYKPIFLDLFQDPSCDQPRPPRSRKQRKPPCNATELFNFCWTLYIFIKGKYPSIPQDLVSCFSLLLACVDLMYTNVIVANRKELLNPDCAGLPIGILESDNLADLSSWPVSIMDYLCKKFEGVVMDTKVIKNYYWKTNIKNLVDQGMLKGTPEGTYLIDQGNFEHNTKEIKNAYEETLLSYGEFDERMFLANDPSLVRGNSQLSSPVPRNMAEVSSISLNSTGINSPNVRSSSVNFSQTFVGDQGDHHLVPQTPITGRRYTINRPISGHNPLTVVTTGLQKLYALIAGRKASPGEVLEVIFSELSENPMEKIANLVREMSDSFVRLYSQETEDYTAPSIEFTNMRLQTGQILYYTFLEHILMDEKKRDVELEAILKEELFLRTLFTCCIEIVLKSYNDARRFPWSLQVGNVEPYYFMRIIEPVIRSEKQSENQLSRELVKHLKSIEEQILDSLSWQNDSPLWQIVKDSGAGVPSCEDVNFSHQLESSTAELNLTLPLPSSSIMSPAVTVRDDVPQSPLSSLKERMAESPNSQGSARRMLFSTPSSTGGDVTSFGVLKLMQPPTLFGLKSVISNPTLVQSANVVSSVLQPITNGLVVAQDNLMINANTSELSPSGTVESRSKQDKPRRHGSLALFFRKFYTLANMRLRDLCDKLNIMSPEQRQKIWTCFEHSIIHYTTMMKDRHMDQNIMCAVYITCKVTGKDRIFQEIMKHYRNQPQAASHVYRSVLISRAISSSDISVSPQSQSKDEAVAPSTPSQVRGTTSTMASGERGDLIAYYNNIYVKNIKTFALKFRTTTQGDIPKLSPLPVMRTTPISPRRRISSNHSVFINSFSSSNSPLKGGTLNLSPKPYVFSRSPAKDLRVINNMVKRQHPAVAKKLNDVLQPAAKICRLDGSLGVGGFAQKNLQSVFEDRQKSFPSATSPPPLLGNSVAENHQFNQLSNTPTTTRVAYITTINPIIDIENTEQIGSNTTYRSQTTSPEG